MVTFLVIVSLLIIAAVALYGEKTVARNYTALADLSVRMIGYFILIALFVSAMYWTGQIVRGLHLTSSAKAQVVVLISYLLGSIPFGFIFASLGGYGDIREIGSGNIGATNVLRTGNKELAALTLVMDGAKGMAAVLVADEISPALGVAAGVVSLLGHMFPVWLEFKGGKGVATAIGAITALSWPVGVAIMVLWIIIAVLFRYSSLAAIVSLAAAPFISGSLINHGGAQFAAIFLMAVCVLLRHAQNVKRLLRGKETKIGEKVTREIK